MVRPVNSTATNPSEVTSSNQTNVFTQTKKISSLRDKAFNSLTQFGAATVSLKNRIITWLKSTVIGQKLISLFQKLFPKAQQQTKPTGQEGPKGEAPKAKDTDSLTTLHQDKNKLKQQLDALTEKETREADQEADLIIDEIRKLDLIIDLELKEGVNFNSETLQKMIKEVNKELQDQDLDQSEIDGLSSRLALLNQASVKSFSQPQEEKKPEKAPTPRKINLNRSQDDLDQYLSTKKPANKGNELTLELDLAKCNLIFVRNLPASIPIPPANPNGTSMPAFSETTTTQQTATQPAAENTAKLPKTQSSGMQKYHLSRDAASPVKTSPTQVTTEQINQIVDECVQQIINKFSEKPAPTIPTAAPSTTSAIVPQFVNPPKQSQAIIIPALNRSQLELRSDIAKLAQQFMNLQVNILITRALSGAHQLQGLRYNLSREAIKPIGWAAARHSTNPARPDQPTLEELLKDFTTQPTLEELLKDFRTEEGTTSSTRSEVSKPSIEPVFDATKLGIEEGEL